MREEASIHFRNFDWISFSLFLSLVGVGWLMVYSVGYKPDAEQGLSAFFGTPAGKQTIWIIISIFAFLSVLLVDWKFWQTFAYIIYGVSMLSLMTVLLIGTEIKGAQSWFTFGGFSLQPSELAKFATALAVSAYLGSFNTSLKDFKAQVISFSFLVLPIALIVLQPDPGSAVVFLSFFIVFYRQGLSPNFYIIGFSIAALLVLALLYPPIYLTIGLLFIGLMVAVRNLKPKVKRYGSRALLLSLIPIIYFSAQNQEKLVLYVCLGLSAVGIILLFERGKLRLLNILSIALIAANILVWTTDYGFNNVLKPHQQDRINVWLHPEKCDPQGSLYNVLRSKMAISSGGLVGKGYLNGAMTKYNYVPEQTTDFIFCTVGEEQGFVGSAIVVILYLSLLIRLTIIAERQRSEFPRNYIYSIVGILFVHFIINIGMTTGLMPIIGIPLPLISKGGSSLLAFTIMMAVLLKLDSKRFSS